ncbi:MAG: PDZ domain-containing protein [Planctomycetes bacterium]|nr:PDZ domain-containing protein [Planctomycetota bacterium]
MQRKIWEALEGLFDFRRLLLELECAAAESGDERIRVGEQDMTVREYAVKRLEEIRPRLEASSSGAVGPLRLIATFEPSAGRVRSPYELPMDLAPVQVLGWAPVDLPADREFFTRGSSVELWSVTERRKIWTGVHPGGWLGVTYQDLKGGAESGVVLKEVFVDSPAEAAGLKVGDVVLQMNGRLVGADSFDALLADAGAGGKARLLTRRGRQSRAVDVTLGSWPAEMRPTIVGAAFTRGYQIAVVWEDAVAAFDAATGRPAWTFRAIRDRFGIARLGAVDGRLFIHEHFRGVDRARSPFRLLSNQMQQERGLLSEKEAYSRLLCLNDDTGEVRWARSFAFDAGAAANHSVEIYADGASDALALLSKAYRANVAVWELQLVAGESGQLWKRILLGNGVTAYVVEERRGILFTVDLSNTRTLRGMKLWGSDAEKGAVVLEVPLQGKYMEQSLHGCGLQARGDWLAVVLPPVQPPHARSGAPAGANGKIVVFSVKTGKEHAVVPLAEGRALPTGRATLVNFDADDVLYVYSIPASKPVPAAGERRAYLAAYRLGDGEDSCALLWESIAPFVAPGSGFLAEIVPAGGSVLLHAQRASLPRDGSERYVAAFYDEGAGGYLQVVVDDVTVGREGPEGAGNSVIVQRGRVCLQTARGLQVYGDREP